MKEEKIRIGKDAWEIEEYLEDFKSKSGRPVFCSAFDEFKAKHVDSYMTCLNITEYLEAYDASPFTKEQWLDSAEYWLGTSSGMPLKIIATFLKS